LDEAQDRAQKTLKSHERAVTAEDFELHARAAGGVARAKALPLFHPEFPNVQVPGVVSVIVVPDTVQTDVLSDPAPMPTEATLQNVCAVLDGRRLATTELYAVAPSYTEVVVTATLTVKAGGDLASVKQQAILTLKRYFHPLIGGDDITADEDGSGWPFGGDIYYSAVVQRLMLPNVRRVGGVVFTLAGQAITSCSDATLPAMGLIKSGAHQINVQYEATS
jgi:predicted phage baseplate assembly protein